MPSPLSPLLSVLPVFACLASCSDDSFTTPEVPVSYRLTLHTAEPKHPTRVVSATIDWQQGLFRSGMNGVELRLPLTKAGDDWTVSLAGQTELPFTSIFKGESLRSPLDSLVVQALTLRPTSGGCSGSLSAYMVVSSSPTDDTPDTFEVRKNFECAKDSVGPSVTVGDEAWPQNPADFRYVGLDESVVGPATASLTDVAGNVLTLAPVVGLDPAAGGSRLAVSAALAFGATYTLTVSGTDLAGNAATSTKQLATVADPGLFAQDGFEGPVNAVVEGGKIVEAPAMAIPAGKRALAFNIRTWGSNRFTARLQAPASATVVKVTYVRIHGGAPDSGFAGMPYTETQILWTIGIPNTTTVATYHNREAPVLSEPCPWTVAPAAQGASGNYFEPQTLTFPLPGPAIGGEVLFDVFFANLPSVGDAGFILDDLRVE